MSTARIDCAWARFVRFGMGPPCVEANGAATACRRNRRGFLDPSSCGAAEARSHPPDHARDLGQSRVRRSSRADMDVSSPPSRRQSKLPNFNSISAIGSRPDACLTSSFPPCAERRRGDQAPDGAGSRGRDPAKMLTPRGIRGLATLFAPSGRHLTADSVQRSVTYGIPCPTWRGTMVGGGVIDACCRAAVESWERSSPGVASCPAPRSRRARRNAPLRTQSISGPDDIHAVLRAGDRGGRPWEQVERNSRTAGQS